MHLRDLPARRLPAVLVRRPGQGENDQLVPDQLDFAILRSRSAAALTVRLTQPSPRGRAPRLEWPRTPRAAASLGPRLARNLARHSAGPREVWGILAGGALEDERDFASFAKRALRRETDHDTLSRFLAGDEGLMPRESRDDLTGLLLQLHH